MFLLGLPMIIVWVIGMPLIALIIIVKNRHQINEWKVKKYMLLLYQGLKPSAFYWEFVNISRKLIILWIITFMSHFAVHYQILLSIVCIVIILKLQMALKPYKNDKNNSIEYLSMVSSSVTLF